MTSKMYDYHTSDYENPKFVAIIDGRKIPLPRYYRQKIFTKHQLKQNAKKQYYRSLKKRLGLVRKFKEFGYKKPFHQVREYQLELARQITVKSSRSKEKL